ncbi:MAG TPA: anti-sigma factor [Acidimicrobiales bacterium]|jgi:uncharacterized protein YggT (Ycf19 family)
METSAIKTTAIKVGRILLWLVYIWVAITLVLLFLSLILELFGANPTAGFVDWVYRSTERAMAPFRGIFEPITFSDKSVLDVSVLFAMIVYGFVALGLHLAIEWFTRLLRAEEARQQKQETEAAASTPRQVLQLVGPSGATATAILTPQAWGTAIQLNASGLDASRSYSVWLEARSGARMSAATFQPSSTGTAGMSLTTSVALADSQTFGVTLLPRPGEQTSTDVLASQLV